MVELRELVRYADGVLDITAFEDYCPNGLQVEGRVEVERIVSGVTASRALIDAAVESGADLLLVHHGFFWRGESPVLTGMKGARIRRLIKADISLLAYHLPLDAHPGLGNNAGLGRDLGVEPEGRFGRGELALCGSYHSPIAPDELAARLAGKTGRQPLLIKGGEHPIRRVGWCSGGAEGYLDAAADLGLDAFISGEISEPTVHIARERGIHYISAGHHATERYGARSLGEHLAERFGLKHRFIDIPNPV